MAVGSDYFVLKGGAVDASFESVKAARLYRLQFVGFRDVFPR